MLPAVTLALPIAGVLTQVLRDGLDRALDEPFAVTARARGLRGSAVLVRHALRHALLPAVTLAGWLFGILLGGAVIVEQVFGRPGLGQVTLQAVEHQGHAGGARRGDALGRRLRGASTPRPTWRTCWSTRGCEGADPMTHRPPQRPLRGRTDRPRCADAPGRRRPRPGSSCCCWSSPRVCAGAARRRDPLAADPFARAAGAERRRTGSAPTSSAGTSSTGSCTAPGTRCASASPPPCSRSPPACCSACSPGSPTGRRRGAEPRVRRAVRLPELLLALLFIAVTGPGTGSLVVAIGIATLPHYARVVRAQTLVVRRSGYVEQAVTFGRPAHPAGAAARPAQRARPAAGARHDRARQADRLAAAGLSFLGMGPQPPSPEWGAMLSEGRNYLRVAWWAAVLPGVAVTLTVISLTVVGRQLQRRFEGRRGA